jgi:hypothetical protein
VTRIARRLGLASSMGLLIFGLGLLVSSVLRLAKLFPNNDPIMAVMLPYAKQKRRWMAVAFPVLAMVLFDLLSAQVGIWTVVTAATYGLLGWGFAVLCARRDARGRRSGVLTYLSLGVAGVFVFDFVTGPVMSSLMFGMSFQQALLGQIPFTLWHLVSVSTYALVVSPALERALLWAARCEPRLARAFGSAENA